MTVPVGGGGRANVQRMKEHARRTVPVRTPILETELPEGTARTERGSNIGDVW